VSTAIKLVGSFICGGAVALIAVYSWFVWAGRKMMG
jgi:hypothetical protein